MPLPNPLRLNHRTFTLVVSTVTAVGSVAFACPSRGKVLQASLTAHGAVTGSSALTMSIAGVAMTIPTTALTTGSAGQTATVEPTAANVVNQGEVITLSHAAGLTGTSAGTWVVVIREF